MSGRPNCSLVEHKDDLILVVPTSILRENGEGPEGSVYCFVLRKAELFQKPHETKIVGVRDRSKSLRCFRSFEHAEQAGVEYADLWFRGKVFPDDPE